MVTLRYEFDIPFFINEISIWSKMCQKAQNEIYLKKGVSKVIAKVNRSFTTSYLRKVVGIKYFSKFCKNRKIVRFYHIFILFG